MCSLPVSPEGHRSLENSRRPMEVTHRLDPDLESRFSCETSYQKRHASLYWRIRDVSARDAHGQRLASSEFGVGRGDAAVRWTLLCNFGTPNYEDYVSVHVKLITEKTDVCADVELAIIAADDRKVNAENKVARLFTHGNERDGADASWGYFSFAKRADLRFNPDLVPDDTLTLFGRVSVYGGDSTRSAQDDSEEPAGEEDLRHLKMLSQDLGRLFAESLDEDGGAVKVNSKDLREGTIILRTDSRDLVVHPHVLTARSPVFRRMLSSSDGSAWSESGSRLVRVPDADPDVLTHFLTYLYSARLPEFTEEILAEDNPVSGQDRSPDHDDDVGGEDVGHNPHRRLIEELMILGDCYDVGGLKSACEARLASTLTARSVPRLLVLADLHHCHKLKTASLAFLIRQPSLVMASPDWRLVEEGHPSLVAEAFRALALKD